MKSLRSQSCPSAPCVTTSRPVSSTALRALPRARSIPRATSSSCSSCARDLGYEGPPFTWNPDRRALLRADLDAYYANLYARTRDELRYILDPADISGDDYPTETFRGLKKNEISKFGEYRTRRLVLEAWDRIEKQDR